MMFAWIFWMAVYAMLELIARQELAQRDPALRDRTVEEAAWGLEWLLKTQFGDGCRMSWSTMRLYTDNKLGSIQYRISNASIANPIRQVNLTANHPVTVPATLTVKDHTKPWVVFVNADHRRDTPRELFGAFVRSFP